MKNNRQILIGLCGLAAAAMLAVVAGGCSGDGGGNGETTQVESVEPGDECPDGGYRIVYGTDEDGDGVIAGEEITASQTLCNGETGETGGEGGAAPEAFDALVQKTDLPAGDPNCPEGGARVDTGLDNGDGEGTAGDGVLQAGEVDHSGYLCDAESYRQVEPVQPPDGPPGAYTMNFSGGMGGTGNGGGAGGLTAQYDYGSEGGHIKLFNTGQADATFAVPDNGSYLGDTVAEVTSGTVTVKAQTSTLTDHAGLGSGALHTHADNWGLWIVDSTATDGHRLATGLSVAAGATVVFEINNAAGNLVHIEVNNDVRNSGTITTERLADGLSAAGLYIACDSFVGTSGSAIDLAGDDGDSGTDGGDGGSLDIHAQDSDLDTTQFWGAIVNQGTIDTSGGAGDTGGRAGDIDLYAYLYVFNTAAITASGGTGNVDTGGAGGQIQLYTEYGDIGNSGALTARGGTGVSDGGSAHEDPAVYFYIDYRGNLYNSGAIDTSGGSASEGDGGDGGEVEFYVYGGGIVNAAPITTVGGEGKDGSGGDGGHIYLKAEYESAWEGHDVPPLNVIVSGNLDTRGGLGTSGGGDGGDMEVYINPDYTPNNQEIIFYGYTKLIANGGDGDDGGDGGYMYLYQEYSEPEEFYTSAGGIYNYLDLEANGGKGLHDDGGDGGYFEATTNTYLYYINDGKTEVVVNYGKITVNGGDGIDNGGDGGYFWVFGNEGAENRGDVSARGGSSQTESQYGGNGGGNDDEGFYLVSEHGPVVNTGNVDLTGGNALGAGGDGGDSYPIEMAGDTVTNSGNLIAAAGDAQGIGDGTGGDSAGIFLYSFNGATSTSGTVDISGGDAFVDDNAGDNGQVIIDGINVTASYL